MAFASPRYLINRIFYLFPLWPLILSIHFFYLFDHYKTPCFRCQVWFHLSVSSSASQDTITPLRGSIPRGRILINIYFYTFLTIINHLSEGSNPRNLQMTIERTTGAQTLDRNMPCLGFPSALFYCSTASSNAGFLVSVPGTIRIFATRIFLDTYNSNT